MAIVIADNGIAGGYKSQPAWNNSYDYWIIKFCDSTLTNLSPTLSSREGVTVFPNPFTNELTISNAQGSEKNKATEIKVYDVFGRIIYSQSFSSSNFKLKTTNWHQGIYFVEVLTNGNRVMQKIIKQ